jgi:hypothetical protein
MFLIARLTGVSRQHLGATRRQELSMTRLGMVLTAAMVMIAAAGGPVHAKMVMRAVAVLVGRRRA